MGPTQQEKAVRFRSLHERLQAFVIPNPWDAGSARLLASLGFEALATSSAAAANAQGRRDGELGRDLALAHVRDIVNATELPVAADLENGFGHDPATVAETIRLAADTGIVGGSIEDSTGDVSRPLYTLDEAVARIAAAAASAKTLPFPFTLTARAENFLHGNPDLDDTIRRLQAYEQAGANVLFAPGLPDLAAVRAVCAAVTRPVHFMAGMRGRTFPVSDLQRAGVRRVSLAGSLYRAAMSRLVEAAREVKEHGTFTFLEQTLDSSEMRARLKL